MKNLCAQLHTLLVKLKMYSDYNKLAEYVSRENH